MKNKNGRKNNHTKGEVCKTRSGDTDGDKATEINGRWDRGRRGAICQPLKLDYLGASQKKTKQQSTKCHDVEPMTDRAEEEEETGKTPTQQQNRKRQPTPEEETTMPTSNKRKESARKRTSQKQQRVATSLTICKYSKYELMSVPRKWSASYVILLFTISRLYSTIQYNYFGVSAFFSLDICYHKKRCVGLLFYEIANIGRTVYWLSLYWRTMCCDLFLMINIDVNWDKNAFLFTFLSYQYVELISHKNCVGTTCYCVDY